MVLRDIIDKFLSTPDLTRKDIDKIKIEFSRKYHLKQIPRNSDLIELLNEDEAEKLIPLLVRKKIRTLSGVNVVAAMTKPYPCPHGRCAYCPGGPESETPTPQSYTGYEPAAMRGAQNDYDPYKQVKSRIKQLELIGHTVDKIDLILMGGTFPASPYNYQKYFVKGCLNAITGINSKTLPKAKLTAENSIIKNVGITVETRPDCVDQNNINRMLELGITRVELGVQTVYDYIYEIVDRGHKILDVIDSTKLLKDASLKICYHMMPGLPGSTIENDLEGFKKLFEDSNFKPDMLKIYPTLVIKGTKLYDWWINGKYTPLDTIRATSLISSIKEIVPPWIRIMRIQRDIPLPRIEAGVDKGNLRQLAQMQLEKNGKKCRCIRCREAGHKNIDIDEKKLQIIHNVYDASDGIEDFISVEDSGSDTLIGFIRLRMPSDKTERPEITSNTGLIRELHVYGAMVPVGSQNINAWQHKGWGETLMEEAEKTAQEKYDAKQMIVMSALGTKQYYYRLGYTKKGPYVYKELN
ncbi:tRNA uridine(34) 5-carboxymethylaminomethyl modification radical SAM/GNAT enzyme Elp3 [Candidatus Bathyarchaeota archaeon]|nr:tRNA uridine(34) 5-carboxymethylaminomethyl modification radical SAM/GNAT enzyme Elp3 [Candidatus Bathyarchaeota archaeon]